MHDYDYAYHDNAESGTFLFGFALGVIGGAAAALLYAPKEGREMRSYLADRARDGQKRASEMAEKSREFVEEGRHAIDQGKEMLSNAVSEGRAAYRRTKGGDAV